MATEEHLETAQDDDYDPFAVFDHAQGAGQVRDPYPVFAELRRQAPIHQGGLWSFFDSENTMASAMAGVLGAATPYFAVTYDAVAQLLLAGGVRVDAFPAPQREGPPLSLVAALPALITEHGQPGRVRDFGALGRHRAPDTFCRSPKEGQGQDQKSGVFESAGFGGSHAPRCARRPGVAMVI